MRTLMMAAASAASTFASLIVRRPDHDRDHRPPSRPAYRSPGAVMAAGDRELAAWRNRRPQRRSSVAVDREALVRAEIKRRMRGDRYARIVAAGGALGL